MRATSAILTAAALLSAASSSSLRATMGAELNFRADYASAVKEAKKSGKGLVVEFETAWCPFCRAMEKVTFKDADVVKASSRLVLARVDADTQEMLARKFDVGEGFPLFVFLDDGQRELFRLEGYHAPESFRLALEAAADPDSPLRRAAREAASRPEDASVQLALGDALYEVGAVEAAAEAYRLASQAGLEGEEAERADSRRAEQARDMGEWQTAEDLYRQLIQEHADSERLPFYRLGLVQTYVGWGREDQARAEAAGLASAFPDHPATRSAAALLPK